MYEPCIEGLHTAIFTSPSGCGKSHFVLDLIEREYNNYFDYIIIIYHSLDRIRHIIRVEPDIMITFGLLNQNSSYIKG